MEKENAERVLKFCAAIRPVAWYLQGTSLANFAKEKKESRGREMSCQHKKSEGISNTQDCLNTADNMDKIQPNLCHRKMEKGWNP